METQKRKQVALNLKEKIEAGLEKGGQEIKCLPTLITPKTADLNGQALVLDLGGTNYRIARVDFVNGVPTIYPEGGWKREITEMKNRGFTLKDLHKAQADPVSELKLENVENIPIGYCFSYAAESLPDGDAKVVNMAKGLNIEGMVGANVGKPLLTYLADEKQLKFKGIKVINDTVASLFAGLTKPGFDAYIGLIVGTGTNMAAFMQTDIIGKLSAEQKEGKGEKIPVNLESGNFHPPHLTIYDDIVDANSDNKGVHRFEKAISGMYLGEIFKSVYPFDEFEERFDAQHITTMLSYPAVYKNEYVSTAQWIYNRSTQLVAASLAGLILVLLSHNPALKKVLLTAEGSLFWSSNRKGKNYAAMVLDELHNLLGGFGYEGVRVELLQIDNANLIGSAIAALS
jgi:hexokinase